jgi:hypothetical protein
MGQWLETPHPGRHRLRIFNCAEEEAQNRPMARARFQHAEVIVSTPRFFLNRLGWFRKDDLRRIGLCVIDEIDLLSIADDTFDDRQRLHEDWRELFESLAIRRIRSLGLTASELAPEDRELFADLAFAELAPLHRSIVPFLPRVRIEPVRCVDLLAQQRDEAITGECKKLVGRLCAWHDLGRYSSSAAFWREIRRIAGGSGEPAEIARTLLKRQRERLDVYEDKNRHASETMTVVKRLSARPPTLVFAREAELVKELARQQEGNNIRTAYAEKGDTYLRDIGDFKARRATILLMTRDLGKRGVNFPHVTTLVLYSPKVSTRTMDQELCRSRGQRRRPKVVTVLCYARTLDEEKLRDVVSRLLGVRMYDKFAKYYLSKPATRWLRAATGRHFDRLFEAEQPL